MRVTPRTGNDALWQALKMREHDWQVVGIKTARIIGDAQSPAPIAWATYAGLRYAREPGEPDRGNAVPFRREIAGLEGQ